MCGIAGYISKTNRYEPDKDRIKIMTDKIAHRGPDAEGQWIDQNVAFGHRRLAIIDLDSQSNQPMVSYDGRFVLTFNGEIYNYVELKKSLKENGGGVSFATNSDTEVIIEAYRRYGAECFNLFNGMWSLALYDMAEQKVIISRDRFGVKPLYMVDNRDILIFASEVKAITAAFPDEDIPNETWIYRYLSGSVSEDADGECFYKNVKIFPPAHYMIYNLKNHTEEYRKYWDVDEKFFYHKWIKGKDPLKTFKGLFESAIELRLRADVEVGSCLSGGIDSSTIVGCASKKYGKRMHTFSSIYTDRECNEEAYIRRVNEKWNAQPHYIRPDDDEKNFTKYIKEITYYHDQPTGGASLYSSYMVMKGVQGRVKVLLNGQGADELFAGYIRHYSKRIADLIKEGSFRSKCKAVKLLTIVKKQWPEEIGSISTDIIVSCVGLRNSFLFKKMDATDKAWRLKRNLQMFTDDFMDKVHDTYQGNKVKCSSYLNQSLCDDLLKNTIPSYLHNEDGNTMAFSLESRLPFLDYRIVEFAIALNGNYKIRNQWTKWIIRKACKEYLPKEVIKRKNKMGFPAPFSRWLRDGESKEEIKNIIYAFAKRNIVPEETIDKRYRSHISGESDESTILFKYYSMELWLSRYGDYKIEGE